MTKGLNDSKVRWLTYLVYLLITVISLVTVYNTDAITSIREKYVRLSRYDTDQARIEKKLDRLIDFMIGGNK